MSRKLNVSVYVSLDGVLQDPVGMKNSGPGNRVGPFNRRPEDDAILPQEL